MAIQKMETVKFNGHELQMTVKDGSPFVPMKPIVEGMGMDWKTQRRNLNSNVERWGGVIMTLPSRSGAQSTLCLPLEKLPAYFSTIHPNKVCQSIRKRVVAFQKECDKALWDYWNNGCAINPRKAAPVKQEEPADQPDSAELDRLRGRVDRLRRELSLALFDYQRELAMTTERRGLSEQAQGLLRRIGDDLAMTEAVKLRTLIRKTDLIRSAIEL